MCWLVVVLSVAKYAVSPRNWASFRPVPRGG